MVRGVDPRRGGGGGAGVAHGRAAADRHADGHAAPLAGQGRGAAEEERRPNTLAGPYAGDGRRRLGAAGRGERGEKLLDRRRSAGAIRRTTRARIGARRRGVDRGRPRARGDRRATDGKRGQAVVDRDAAARSSRSARAPRSGRAEAPAAEDEGARGGQRVRRCSNAGWRGSIALRGLGPRGSRGSRRARGLSTPAARRSRLATAMAAAGEPARAETALAKSLAPKHPSCATYLLGAGAQCPRIRRGRTSRKMIEAAAELLRRGPYRNVPARAGTGVAALLGSARGGGRRSRSSRRDAGETFEAQLGVLDGPGPRRTPNGQHVVHAGAQELSGGARRLHAAGRGGVSAAGDGRSAELLDQAIEAARSGATGRALLEGWRR